VLDWTPRTDTQD